MSDYGLVAVDVGNRRTKLAIADSWSNDTPWHQQLVIGRDQPIEFPLRDHRFQWEICSVCPPEQQRLIAWIDANRPEDSVRVLTHSDIPMSLDVDEPESVGMDRLVAATMAYEQASKNDVVVIDAGTAVTVDAVKDGTFLGGTIMPGAQTQFESLQVSASQLPLVNQTDFPVSPIGKSTTDAIEAGVMYGQIGAILFVVDQIARLLNDPKFVMTGGGLLPIQSKLPSGWIAAPELVLNGIRHVTRIRRQVKH